VRNCLRSSVARHGGPTTKPSDPVARFDTDNAGATSREVASSMAMKGACRQCRQHHFLPSVESEASRLRAQSLTLALLRSTTISVSKKGDQMNHSCRHCAARSLARSWTSSFVQCLILWACAILAFRAKPRLRRARRYLYLKVVTCPGHQFFTNPQSSKAPTKSCWLMHSSQTNAEKGTGRNQGH